MADVRKSEGEIRYWLILVFIAGLISCNKSSDPTPNPPPPPPPSSIFDIARRTINSAPFNSTQTFYGINTQPNIRVSFTDKVDKNSVAAALSFINKSQNATAVPYNLSYQNNDSAIVITPSNNLAFLNEYIFSVSTAIKSVNGKAASTRVDLDFVTQIDSSDKFSRISDSALIDLVQKQTFKYFWDFAHQESGMARERNTSGETITSGGSGFGVMAMIAAVKRNFITRQQALTRLQMIVDFLKNKAATFHGAFPHWMNGSTGAVVPFGNQDGADIVETSYLMMGLLSARQYFNGGDAAETSLRSDIDALWKAVDWNFFTQGQNVLYWNWSPNIGFVDNVTVRGWNETLITYVMAASSPTHPITKAVYDNGFAGNGAMKNGKTFYGYTLPLGPDLGGPLFFEHYSFMGIDPKGLSDQYANYETQTANHTKINYEYCKANPKNYYGYSDSCWGLTASDIPTGYTASSPTNDVGVIAPTAAISSLPYTPVESMQALKFFYYTLGDKLWGDYGFYDAFSLHKRWFANSYLAIDQGPQVVMLENYRSSLLWNLFMSCPEVQTGMKTLGFQSPHF